MLFMQRALAFQMRSWLGRCRANTLTEIAQVVSWMSDVTTIPIVVDADTGFGNAINMQRTVKILEKGAVTQIEDQSCQKNAVI